jgi:hypothetical protein
MALEGVGLPPAGVAADAALEGRALRAARQLGAGEGLISTSLLLRRIATRKRGR